MVYIKSEKITRTKNIVKGSFVLSDKSKTNFWMRKGDNWTQWGNDAEKLNLTVAKVQKLHHELQCS